MTHTVLSSFYLSVSLLAYPGKHTFMHINSMQKLIHTQTEAIVSNGIHN